MIIQYKKVRLNRKKEIVFSYKMPNYFGNIKINEEERKVSAVLPSAHLNV